MGANHEIQRLDRSDYLTVLWDKIHYSKYPQYSVRKGTRDRFPYDYHSVMHYRLSVSLSIYLSKLSIYLVNGFLTDV